MTHSSTTTSSSCMALAGGTTRPLSVLHVMPEFPYPPVHGGRLDMWGRLCDLSRLGHRLHLIATVKEPPDPMAFRAVESHVSKIQLVQRTRSVRSAATLQPFQAASRQLLRGVAVTGKYDIVLLEQDFVAPILDNRNLR